LSDGLLPLPLAVSNGSLRGGVISNAPAPSQVIEISLKPSWRL
jgi:hypothetical protein